MMPTKPIFPTAVTDGSTSTGYQALPRGSLNRGWLLILLVVSAVIAAPGPAWSQTRTAAADVGAYCRERFGPTATPGIDRRNDGLLCTERVSGGLGLRHHRIRPSQVCLRQQRTNRFRRSGTRVVCVIRAGDRRDDARPKEKVVDLATYCRRRYGPDTMLTRRRADDRPMCSVRTDRGLGLRHHLIDPRAVCNGQRYRMGRSRVRCAVAERRAPKRRPKVTTIDLRNFCRRAFGQSAVVTRRRTDGRPMCTVRTDRGLGLRHHVIDPGRACGGRRFRMDGNRLLCITGT